MHIITQLFKYFIRGIVFVLPLLIAVWLIMILASFFNRLIPGLESGLSLIAGIALLIGIGWITKRTFAKKIKKFAIDSLLVHLPIIGHLVRGLHRIPLFNQKESLHEPVWIDTGNDQRKIGFLIHESLPQFDLPHHAAVLVPSAFSPQSECIIIPLENLSKIDRSAEASLFFSVTGGVVENPYAKQPVHKDTKDK